MAYQLNTLDKNIISEIWRRGGTCTIAELKETAKDLPEPSLLLYIRNLSRKRGILYFPNLSYGDMPTTDTEVSLETELYAMWRA